MNKTKEQKENSQAALALGPRKRIMANLHWQMKIECTVLAQGAETEL